MLHIVYLFNHLIIRSSVVDLVMEFWRLQCSFDFVDIALNNSRGTFTFDIKDFIPTVSTMYWLEFGFYMKFILITIHSNQ